MDKHVKRKQTNFVFLTTDKLTYLSDFEGPHDIFLYIFEKLSLH